MRKCRYIIHCAICLKKKELSMNFQLMIFRKWCNSLCNRQLKVKTSKRERNALFNPHNINCTFQLHRVNPCHCSFKTISSATSNWMHFVFIQHIRHTCSADAPHDSEIHSLQSLHALIHARDTILNLRLNKYKTSACYTYDCTKCCLLCMNVRFVNIFKKPWAMIVVQFLFGDIDWHLFAWRNYFYLIISIDL